MDDAPKQRAEIKSETLSVSPTSPSPTQESNTSLRRHSTTTTTATKSSIKNGQPQFVDSATQSSAAAVSKQSSINTTTATANNQHVTFKNQHTLPALPVPDLKQTLEKYLDTVRPFLSDKDFANTRAAVDSFLDPYDTDIQKMTNDTDDDGDNDGNDDNVENLSCGELLQRRLLKRAKQAAAISFAEPFSSALSHLDLSKDGFKKETAAESFDIAPTLPSWLVDWWNEYSYLRYRESVVLNVSFFFVLPDDPYRRSQIQRAALIAYAAASFKESLINFQLEPETMRSSPMCMYQYNYLFNSCRIPQKPSDYVKTYDPYTFHHIIVAYRNQFFSFSLKKDTNGHQTLLTIPEIELQLKKVVSIGDTLSPSLPIGALTADHRDTWSLNNATLRHTTLSRTSLERIQSSSFLLCLDPPSSFRITPEDMAHTCWHGWGLNRWFDKSVQFVVECNGRAGVLGEHSMMEATVPGRLCDAVAEILLKPPENDDQNEKVSELEEPEWVQFECSEKEWGEKVQTSLKNLRTALNQRDLKTYQHPEGKRWIKQFGVSPDAFVQMAIQLAYYRLAGTVAATYETAGMRRYACGRTETCRSVSSDSLAFVKAFDSSDVGDDEKIKLLKTAILAQSKYMAECLQGKGIDRHLLGLRLSLKPGEPLPAIFADPAYSLSCHWTLSTSQIPSEYLIGYGWGEVVPDGFGIAYMVREDELFFNIVGRVSRDPPPPLLEPPTWHDLERSNRVEYFRHFLSRSLSDLFALIKSHVSFNVKQSSEPRHDVQPGSVKPKEIADAVTQTHQATCSTLPRSSSTPSSPTSPISTSHPFLHAASSYGLSLAYPQVDEPQGVGEEVGLIEFEWGDSKESRPTRFVKMLQGWKDKLSMTSSASVGSSRRPSESQ